MLGQGNPSLSHDNEQNVQHRQFPTAPIAFMYMLLVPAPAVWLTGMNSDQENELTPGTHHCTCGELSVIQLFTQFWRQLDSQHLTPALTDEFLPRHADNWMYEKIFHVKYL